MKRKKNGLDEYQRRNLTEDEVWWAIAKVVEGYKTSWISEALNTNDKTLQRNISYYTWFDNLGQILRWYGREPLVYDKDEYVRANKIERLSRDKSSEG